MKFAVIGPTRAKWGSTMWPASWPVWWALFVPRGIPCHHILLTVFHFQKNDVAKILDPFDIRRSLKVKKHAKTKQICFAMLKPNERGLFRKFLDSMEYMSRSLINYPRTKNIT
jgi:hypothetical protein